MNYRQDKRIISKKDVLTGLGIILVTYVIFGTSIGSAVQSGLERVVAPLRKATNEQTLSADIFGMFRSKITLTQENESLKKELFDLGLKLLDRNLLYEENLLLKEKVGRFNVNESIYARVIAKPTQSAYDTLIIDIGDENGLRGGERVMYGDNILIGSVAEVGTRTAKVKLFSSYGEETAVVIGPQKISAIAHGYGGGNFEIKIPRDTPVEKGDIILAPSLMPHILGTVEYLESKPNDPFKRVLFMGPVSPLLVNYVVVLLNM